MEMPWRGSQNGTRRLRRRAVGRSKVWLAARQTVERLSEKCKQIAVSKSSLERNVDILFKYLASRRAKPCKTDTRPSRASFNKMAIANNSSESRLCRAEKRHRHHCQFVINENKIQCIQNAKPKSSCRIFMATRTIRMMRRSQAASGRTPQLPTAIIAAKALCTGRQSSRPS